MFCHLKSGWTLQRLHIKQPDEGDATRGSLLRFHFCFLIVNKTNNDNEINRNQNNNQQQHIYITNTSFI